MDREKELRERKAGSSISRQEFYRRKLKRRRRIRRRKIIIGGSLLLFLLVLLYGILHSNLLQRLSGLDDRIIIVIDPGHGGDDPGANYGEVREKDINLEVALSLRDYLEKNKEYKVILTRKKDVTVELYDRSKLANDKEADIFISLHCNDLSGGEQADGIETYYTFDEEESMRLATCLQEKIISETGAKDRGIRTEDFAVIRETEMPAVLVEMGFLSDAQEKEKLLDAGYQEKIAKAIADGVTDYLNQV